jgi:alkylation response protein AidB-like acyl-CoA dehydrogenase
MSSFVMDLARCGGVGRDSTETRQEILSVRSAEMLVDNVRLPEEALLGGLGQGPDHAMSIQRESWISIAALSVGIGRSALEETLQWVRGRHQAGKGFVSTQTVQWRLADMAMEMDAAELLTVRAAWVKDRGKPFEKEAAMARSFASDAAMAASAEGLQIMGGYGDCSMEEHMKNAKTCQVSMGTNEMAHLLVAGGLTRGA